MNFNGNNIIELDCMIHCAITGMRFPTLVPRADIITDLPSAPEKAAELDAESSSTDQAVRPLPPLPPTTTATPTVTVTATATDNKNADKGEAQIVPDPTEENGAPVTPVKGKTTEDLGVGQQKTPERTEATTAENEFVTPIKRGSHRYVPILSPHSTVMATPNETEGTPQTTMQRMSGRITNWRKSVTAIASPAPLLEKVGDVKAASVRKLSALTSALSSPIAGAASILRMDGVKGASPMRDETVTPARTELSHQQLQEVGQEEGASTTKAMTADDSVAAASVNSLARDLDVVAVYSPKPHQCDTNSDSNTDTSLTGNNREDNREDALLTAALEQRALPVEAAEVLSPELDPILHPEQWLQAYTHSVICNYQAAHAGISAIIDLYTYVQAHEDIETSVSSGKTIISSTTTAETLQALCLLESNYTEIIEELLVYSDEKERIAILKEKIDLCNLQVTLHWSLLMTALRRVMPQLCPLLKAQYRIVARRFWRGQVLVQTKR